MKKSVYFVATLIGMGGIWCSCSDDEKTVEVEKIVVEQDITKLSDAIREGFKGNPKTVTEFYSSQAAEDAQGKVSPGAWTEKNATFYNAEGYITKVEGYSSYYTALEKDMPNNPEDTWYKMTTPELKLISTTTMTLGTDNRPTGIVGEEGALAYFIKDADGVETMIYETSSQPFDVLEWYGIETPQSLVLKQTSVQKIITTIDLTTRKATIITQSKEEGQTTWTDSKKEVADLDEYGYPNENSKEEFGVKEEATATNSKAVLGTRAFQDKPSVKYVEVLDAKGNWITRYVLGDNSSYIKREIVYY